MINAKEFQEDLKLECLVSSPKDVWDFRTPDLNRPGMQFCGFYEYFAFERPQVIGKVEMSYLEKKSPAERRMILEKYFSYNDKIIALNSVRDPSNLGAIIRSAVAFGVSHIVLSSDCVDPYNPKTVRAAMGALFKIKITIVSDFASFIRDSILAGRNVYAAELREGAFPLDEIAFSSQDIVIIGNEGHGIDESISSLCTASVYIPISGMIESLNASVAASILMWELSKAKNGV